MSLHFKTGRTPAFSPHSFQLKSSIPHTNLNTSPDTITSLLNLHLHQNPPSEHKRKSKYPVFAKFLQKSPNPLFHPLENTEKGAPIIHVEQVHLTQTTRKEGPARHRNSIILKLDLINQVDNKSNENITMNKTERIRARSSVSMDKSILSLSRASFDKEKKPKGISFKDNVKGFNICEEMKNVTSSHFFNKLKEIKSKENTKIQGKKNLKEKSNTFYQDLMLSHFFVSKLKDEERDRFSHFLMNDWVNKLIFERKINETGAITEFLDNPHEIETSRKFFRENKEIREKFQNFFNKIDKTELFHPQNILNKFRESINMNRANSMKKTLKFSSLDRYLSSKDYTTRDQDFQISNSAMKSLKTSLIKKKRKFCKPLNKESLWEIRDSIIEYARLVKELGHIFPIEFLVNKFQSRAFDTTGSYMYIKFVKRGKIAYIEKMIKENPKLPFEFDLVLF